MKDLEVGVLPRQLLKLRAISKFLFVPARVHEAHVDRKPTVRSVLRHAFEGRDADAARDEDGGRRLAEHEMAVRAIHFRLVPWPERRKRLFPRRIRNARPKLQVGLGRRARKRHWVLDGTVLRREFQTT